MGPAYVVPLPGYGYAAQQAPSIAHLVPLPQPLNHHTPLDRLQSVNHYGHDFQNPSPVRAHYGGNLHFKDAHFDAKSVEYELLEDVVSPVKKSTKTHKTSYHVSSKPVEHNRYEDSALISTSSHNHEDND